MQRLKVRTIGEGQHPSEAIVELTTAEGLTEELIVDKRAIEDDSVKIGYPISRRDGDQFLVELPRETLTGLWRVWVRLSDLKEARA